MKVPVATKLAGEPTELPPMPLPDVQPLAYLAPKPTSIPATKSAPPTAAYALEPNSREPAVAVAHGRAAGEEPEDHGPAHHADQEPDLPAELAAAAAGALDQVRVAADHSDSRVDEREQAHGHEPDHHADHAPARPLEQNVLHCR